MKVLLHLITISCAALSLTGCLSDVEELQRQLATTQGALVSERQYEELLKQKAGQGNALAQYALITNHDQLAARYLNAQGNLFSKYTTLTPDLADEAVRDAASEKQADVDTTALSLIGKKITLELNQAQTKTDLQFKKTTTLATADAKKADTLDYRDSWFGLPGFFHYLDQTWIIFALIIAGLIAAYFLIRYALQGAKTAAEIIK